VIFGCSDSRLAAEIIFDLGLGDAFVVRTAGHVIDNTVLGSLEYSIDYLQVPRIAPSVLTSLRHDEHEVNDMVVEHVKQTAQRLVENSPIIATAV
jgi:carbonic anhydrase